MHRYYLMNIVLLALVSVNPACVANNTGQRGGGVRAARNQLSTGQERSSEARSSIEFDLYEADDFIRRVALRQKATEDMRLIGRLVEEMEQNLQDKASLLFKKFSYLPGGRYRMDAEGRNLIGSVGEAQDGVDVLHHFSGGEEAQFFKDEVSAHNRLQVQVGVLRGVFRERSNLVDDVNQFFWAEYGIDPTKNYRYDAQTRRLVLIPDTDLNNRD